MTLDAYTDLDTFRLFIRSAAVADDIDDPDSAIEALAVESAARAIDRACGRTFRLADVTASARYFTYTPPRGWDVPVYDPNPQDWYRHAVLPIDDVADTTGMIVTFDTSGNGDYTLATTEYRVGPSNATARQMPYSSLIFDSGTYPPSCTEGVKVEALWGWGAIPQTIVNANLIQASRFYKRRDAPFGIAGSPDMGSELRLLAKLDPDVALMVGAYKRNWGAV
jgi:hypothetical protein